LFIIIPLKSQVVYSDPPETVITPPSRYLYSKEIAQCPSGESKMMLTLLLQSLKWSDVGEKKKEKAIKKMSRFFHVPVVSVYLSLYNNFLFLHIFFKT